MENINTINMDGVRKVHQVAEEMGLQAVFEKDRSRHLIKPLETFEFMQKYKDCLLTVKKKIRKIDGQGDAINT